MKPNGIGSRQLMTARRALRTLLAVLTLSIVSAGLFSAPAQAASIQGSIDFGGVVTFDSMSLATATRVINWDNSFVLQSFGDFAGIAPGTPSTMAAPWIFNPSTPTLSLWSVGGFTFDLASSTIVEQSSTFLNITGAGTISGNGFDPTPGTWSFSASRADGGMASSFGFQAQTNAVPEASSIVLLGLASSLLLVGKFRRRKSCSG